MTDEPIPSLQELEGGSWHCLGPADELQFDPGAAVDVGSTSLAVFPLAGGYVGIENSCPHQGAALADGVVDEDGSVACLWHGWTFDLRTGVCRMFDDVRVPTWRVVERDGVLWAKPA
jgi:nitrite reductase/ring-hydroxylating ferredoxin subunit